MASSAHGADRLVGVRYCRFIDAGRPRVGLVTSSGVQPFPADAGVLAVIAGAEPESGPIRPLKELELLPPIDPGKVFGIALNYRAHAIETGKEIPPHPRPFAKLTSALTGPTDEIHLPAFSDEVDYEGELAVVIGRRAKGVAAEQALDHVFGYLVMNDVSARDAQRAEPQWIRAKGCDTFGPCGPWLTGAEAVPDPQDLRIRTWINDELRQDGSTSDMIFSVAELIAWISASITLEPGDVLVTGTPSGVGVAMDPPRFLKAGDRVRIEIDGLGSLDNPVVDGA